MHPALRPWRPWHSPRSWARSACCSCRARPPPRSRPPCATSSRSRLRHRPRSGPTEAGRSVRSRPARTSSFGKSTSTVIAQSAYPRWCSGKRRSRPSAAASRNRARCARRYRAPPDSSCTQVTSAASTARHARSGGRQVSDLGGRRKSPRERRMLRACLTGRRNAQSLEGSAVRKLSPLGRGLWVCPPILSFNQATVSRTSRTNFNSVYGVAS